MTLINIMETIVIHLFEEFQQSYHLKCACDLCKTDILALTLNKIPPHYVSTNEGEVLIKASYTDTQMKQDIIKELTFAALKVEQNPRHEID